MGLSRFAGDTLNVHDYERKGKDGRHVYSAYYEYAVAPTPIDGGFPWWARIYDRASGEVVERIGGVESTYEESRYAAQARIGEEMKKFERKAG